MNEASFWSKVRGAINTYPHGVAHKLTDMFTAGTPDALYCIAGHTGVLELKYVPKWPVRIVDVEVGLTENQRTWLLDWHEKGWGSAHVLLGVEQDWFLLDVAEVPPPPSEKKAPRVNMMYLEGVRARGDGGTFRDLKSLLPAVLAGK